ESSAFSDSNLLSGWLSYVRADYRDSLSNESHFPLPCTNETLIQQPFQSQDVFKNQIGVLI
ncbi:MAG: hypothetical protein V7K22_10540, partial [Nostoc sp.]